MMMLNIYYMRNTSSISYQITYRHNERDYTNAPYIFISEQGNAQLKADLSEGLDVNLGLEYKYVPTSAFKYSLRKTY